MAIPTRLIKRRIKSIRSTGKIMKAMELVAASKMRRATQLTLSARPYAKSIQTMSHELRQAIDPRLYSYLVGNSQAVNTKVVNLLVVLASDRGLCGGFNNQLIRKSIEFIKGRSGQEVRVVAVGRRAEQSARRAGIELLASFESIANAPSFERVTPVANLIAKEFLDRRVHRVWLAYTDFKSALQQIPTVEQLLPIVPEVELTGLKLDNDAADRDESKILFEPTADDVLRRLLPRMVEMQIYQAFLESAASEHSARMMAMRSAGDAASEMLDNLTFTLNQARQSAITREISEISAGKAALE